MLLFYYIDNNLSLESSDSRIILLLGSWLHTFEVRQSKRLLCYAWFYFWLFTHFCSQRVKSEKNSCLGEVQRTQDFCSRYRAGVTFSLVANIIAEPTPKHSMVFPKLKMPWLFKSSPKLYYINTGLKLFSHQHWSKILLFYGLHSLRTENDTADSYPTLPKSENNYSLVWTSHQTWRNTWILQQLPFLKHNPPAGRSFWDTP